MTRRLPFSIATTSRCRGGHYSFLWIATLYPYLIMLSAKQVDIKYQFFEFLVWAPVSRTIGEHYTH